MAAQAAFLALPTAVQASAGSAGTSTSASLSGLAASSAAAGAAAMPGASGAVRVTPATASESALPTGQKSLLSQVEGTIRYLVKDQDQSAELQLHPESLGRVQINLKVEGTVVHAKLWASEASAVPVMQQHRSFLEASLKAQGLTLGSFDLQQGRREDQAAQSAPAPSPATTSAPAVSAAPETPATPSAAPVRSNRIEYVA
jgi:flagellar hook-length control protein FliK